MMLLNIVVFFVLILMGLKFVFDALPVINLPEDRIKLWGGITLWALAILLFCTNII